eukprot:CAMPEP_0201513858 /NCGR_PEP_ID=MMETSP0161_2-20130828/5826_1 /ASSEMBLY_ACC=CAM_ASM_000251 /TAXON_ID=180227 /ORGANISM="Neoparamoeba aestuarina, Strain SoJaBio B1-5/56/2" /LENGTH=550 /DNA_ID=CAMNT_0047910235 /DNA_START=31 /DNA_END=1683 /DNA_ORIENTATION=+
MAGYKQEDRCYEEKRGIFGGLLSFLSVLLCPSFWLLVIVVVFRLVLALVRKFFGLFSKHQRKHINKKQRIAVVGGGIAGSAAAWSLHRDAFDVTLYETRGTLGGNAKTHRWQNQPNEKQKEQEGGEGGALTGLSVLAWPKKYFHNYGALLQEIGVKTCEVELPFHLRDPDVCDFRHGQGIKEAGQRDKNAKSELEKDQERWMRLVNWARWMNIFLTRSDSSIYAYNPLNPFNVLPVHFTATKLFFVSEKYWESVLVPLYSSSFLTQNIESLPCAILPAVDDMISVESIPKMNTWTTSSADVFARLTRGMKNVKCGRAVLEVRPILQRDGSYKHLIRDSNNDFDYYDKVVFACSSDQALRCLRTPTFLQKQLLTHITYCDDHDHTFSKGYMHRDSKIIPEDLREDLMKNCSNYIRIYREQGKRGEAGDVTAYENTFILNWVPASKGKTNQPMLVTYNSQHEHIDDVQGTVSNLRAHPDLSVGNLMCAQLLGLVQGERGVYFCGSYTTPGNGHDLSLLSGLIVAHDIGAAYPFTNNPKAMADFHRLRGLMHL